MLWLTLVTGIGLIAPVTASGRPPVSAAQWKACVAPAATTTPTAKIAACTVLLTKMQPTPREATLAFYHRAVAKRLTNDEAGMDNDLALALEVPAADPAAMAVVLALQGELRIFQKRPREARAAYDRAIEFTPADPNLRFVRARRAFDEKRFEDARADLDVADRLTMQPRLHSQVHVLRGLVNSQGKAVSAVRADFERAVEVAPSDVDALWARGGFFEDQREFEKAVADFVRVTELAPRSAIGFNSLCWVLAANLRRELDRARTACDTALNLAPKNPSFVDSAGLVALQQRRWQDAWAHYDAALAAKPDYASAFFGRGIAASRLGRTVNGRSDVATATARDASVASKYSGYGQTP